MVDPGASSVYPVKTASVPSRVPPEAPSSVPTTVRREALLRGPLILTACSRVLTVPFFFYCAVASSNDVRRRLPSLHRYPLRYSADTVLLAGSMWVLLLLSVLLAWLFFSRRRAFRPMMIYFCLLLLTLLVGIGVHSTRFPAPSHSAPPRTPIMWLAFGILGFMFSGFFWPFYYAFSPRVKRVFTR